MKRKNMVTAAVGLICGLAMAIMLPLWSQAAPADRTLAKRLQIIEKQLKAVQRKVFTPGSRFRAATPDSAASSLPDTGGNMGGNMGGSLADIEARLSQMETQLRQITGRVEEGNYQMGRLKQQMETMTRDYEFRIAALEKSRTASSLAPKADITAKPTVRNKPKAEKADILPAGTEQQQYSYAQKLVTKGQYARAEVALSAFLTRYPKARLAGNAQYWLGQTYYVRKMYTRATRAFLEGYNNYPESPKAPAFLLKIGMSLFAMGEKNDACDAYRELASRFPTSLESRNKRPPEEKRARCK